MNYKYYIRKISILTYLELVLQLYHRFISFVADCVHAKYLPRALSLV